MPTQKKEKPRHLGRGLQSLIGPIITNSDSHKPAPPYIGNTAKFPPDAELAKAFRHLPLELILTNPYQPRQSWDETELADLAESIKTNGVIQPIIVRPVGEKYQLIAGERRFRAAKLVALATIPALVREASDAEMLELALIENIHRADLNPLERAQAYQSYINRFSLSQVEAAKRLSEDRSVISNYLRLLELPIDVKNMLAEGQLSMGHARAMLALPDEHLRRKVANQTVVAGLSVREVEKLVRRYLNGPRQPKTQTKPAHIVDLQDKLSGLLGTKVMIETRSRGHRGKIIIDFYSLDEFDRLTEQMGLKPVEAS